MKYRAWFEGSGRTLTDVARELQVSVEAVRRYVEEKRIPGKDIMLRIVKMTDGAVQPNDWFIETEAAGGPRQPGSAEEGRRQGEPEPPEAFKEAS